MLIDDRMVLNYLDDEWRTVAEIRDRLSEAISNTKLVAALHRLVTDGRVEKKAGGEMVSKGGRAGAAPAVELFRRPPF